MKDSILIETYYQVRVDLKEIAEKYPETEEDIKALLKKYTLAEYGSEQSFDIAKAEAEFKLIERERKILKEQLSAIEKRKKNYEENESKKRLIAENGKLLRVTYDAAKAKLAALEKDGSFEEVKSRHEELKVKKAQIENRLQVARDAYANAVTVLETNKALKEKSVIEWGSASEISEKALKDNGFTDILEVQELSRKLGDEKTAREGCDKFFAEYGALKKQIESTDSSRFESVFEETVYDLKTEKRRLDEEKKMLGVEIGKAENELKKLKEIRKKFLELKNEYNEKKRTSELWERLRSCVSGRRSDKTLMDFIAAEYLQDVCLDAGRTLIKLTGGRYFLKYTNGEFYVGDNLDGGELRAVKTLSGGETFLVSLSLALSLSAAICQKSMRPIEFFFLDEGFGTLDGKLVETVMDVLSKLSKDFTVGLISHVEELKHRIESKILIVGATETHGSQIRLETF